MSGELNINISHISLSLGYNVIDNEGCIAIAEALNINTSLISLNLENNFIDNE